MDRLAALIEAQTGNRPYVPDTLYLFCGRRIDRIKGLVWEGDGWLLLYKRLSESRFQWPRSPEEVHSLTPQQFRWLMEGLTITPQKSVRQVEPPESSSDRRYAHLPRFESIEKRHRTKAISAARSMGIMTNAG